MKIADSKRTTRTKYFKVKVNPAPNLNLNQTKMTIGVNETYTLKSSNYSNVSYSSSNINVITVSKSGTITAKRTGNATITAKAKFGSTSKQAKCTITVKKAPTKFTLNRTSLTLGIGETYNLNSKFSNGEGAYHIYYSSNNNNTASVKKSGGYVTAKKEGTATVTATTYNGKKAVCKVTVKKAPSKVSLNKTSLTLGIGEKFDLNSSVPSGTASHNIKYSSNNPKIAKVEMYGGLVTAKSTGTAIITATTYNGQKAICKVTVKKAPSTVSFQNKKYTVKVGTTQNLTLKFSTDSTSYKNTYSSSDSKIVSVNKNGKITAKKMGEATIRVKTFNGKETICKITVTPEKATSNTYNSMISDLAKVNPNYYNGYEWTVNCQRCVPTYELRRRGYDVTALPNYNENDIWRTCQDAANKCNGSVWGKIKQHTECSNRQEVENYIRKCGKNTRFQISVEWKTGGAHTFVAEEIDGKIYFIDPQSNKIDASSHFNKCKSIRIYRIDNADVSALIDYCYKSNTDRKYQMDQLFK